MSAEDPTWQEVRDGLAVAEDRCTLCGLVWRGPGTLCRSCSPFAGLSVSEHGWCLGRHRLRTAQRDESGRWACLEHGGGRYALGTDRGRVDGGRGAESVAAYKD